MSSDRPLYSSVAPLPNVAALVELIERVEAREYGLPGMATFYGPSGWGKTTAAVFAANRFGAYQVQVKSVWTKKKLCQAILDDMGLPPAKTIADMVDQIAQHLGQTGKVLLVDEADHLVRRNNIELIRDIHESSGTTTILIGEENLPTKLTQWERIHGRMLDWVAAEPGSLEDVELLAGIYAPKVEIAPDLQEELLVRSAYSIRRISVSLTRLQEWARARGKASLCKAEYDGGFFTGVAPTPRRVAR